MKTIALCCVYRICIHMSEAVSRQKDVFQFSIDIILCEWCRA